MNYLEKYREYLKTVRSKLNQNEYIKASSQKSYYSQLQNISKYFISRGFTNVLVYETDDLNLLYKLDKLFYIDDELREKNDKGQNQYSVALHHYIRMLHQLNGQDFELEEDYNKRNNDGIVNKIKHNKINKGKLLDDSRVSEKFSSVIRRNRSHDVAAYTRQRANGVCDLCGETTPFVDKNGIPYLETHHLLTLAEGGPDVIFNTVALCPNCHRKIHTLDSEEDKDFLKRVIFKYLLKDDEKEIILKFNKLFDE